jgi:hypothetical protein
MKSIVRDIYPPNGTAELTRAIVLPSGLTRARSATADDGKAGLKSVCFSHAKVRLYAVKRLVTSSGEVSTVA